MGIKTRIREIYSEIDREKSFYEKQAESMDLKADKRTFNQIAILHYELKEKMSSCLETIVKMEKLETEFFDRSFSRKG